MCQQGAGICSPAPLQQSHETDSWYIDSESQQNFGVSHGNRQKIQAMRLWACAARLGQDGVDRGNDEALCDAHKHASSCDGARVCSGFGRK